LINSKLANLYSRQPTWLDLTHRRLDESVFVAYGWLGDLSDEANLGRLLALNLTRAGRQQELYPMTKQDQYPLDLIRERERRLQILEKRAATLGINTPPEVLMEIEDIREKLKESKRALKIDDPLLSFLLAISVFTLTPVGITLTLNGLMVAGYLTTAQYYGQHFLDSLVEKGAMSLNPEIAEASCTTHLHLRDARLYPISSGPIPPYDQPGIFWRGKLSAIDSYALGRPTATGWEVPPVLITKSNEDDEAL